MLTTIAVQNYRSLSNLVIPLGGLNLITGPNGSGKSNIYRALRLLAETAQSGVIASVANEGGIESAFSATPTQAKKRGPKRLRLGLGGDELGYSISLGLPALGPDNPTAFRRDPEIKHECIWAGPSYNPVGALVERNDGVVKVRSSRTWEVTNQHFDKMDSILGSPAVSDSAPGVIELRELVRSWRFYDQFRTDGEAPSRLPQIGTRTPVLHHDGRDLAAAIQTIREIGDFDALESAIEDAFPGSRISVLTSNDHFSVELEQPGLLRPLSAMELSDGTLRYLLWVAALLTPRPPPLMVLNEPETSLHPELVPALARLIVDASARSQVWVISHSDVLIAELTKSESCNWMRIGKDEGETSILDLPLTEQAVWRWPDR